MDDDADRDRIWTPGALYARLEAGGDAPAVRAVGADGVETVSCAELLDRAGRLAAGLRARGLEPGDRAVLLAPNGPDWIAAWLGLRQAGAVVAALDDLSGADELAAAVPGSGASLVFAHPKHLAALADLPGAAEREVFTLGPAPEGGGDAAAAGTDARSAGDWRDLLAGTSAPVPAFDPAAPAVLVHTSGTTGAPKRFVLTNANIGANIGAILAENLIGPADRVFLPLPLHHVYPLVVGMMAPLAAGASVALPAAATAGEITRALRLTRATVMIGVPRLYAALADGLAARMRARGRLAAALYRGITNLARRLRPLVGRRAGRVLFRPLHARLGGRLRLMVSGGARLEPGVIARLEALGFDVLTGYGLAETASLFTGNRPGQKRLGSEGRALAGGEVRIAEPDSEGIGEIELRGPSVFAGYEDGDELNRAAFTKDGWFRTGDLGRLDADGYLYVTGRSKDMIVLGGGKNVDPEALERRYGADPAIAEIAVLERDGRLVGLVVPDTAALRAAARTNPEDAVRVALEAAGARLPSHERLAGFALTREPLPRTRLGKYRRFLLPDLYDEAKAGAPRRAPAALTDEDRRLLEDPVAGRAWKLLEARYADRGLALDAHPALDLGMDSLEWMTVSLELESRLGVRIPDEAAARVESVRDLLAAAIEAARAGDGEGRAAPAAGGEDAARWIRPTGPALEPVRFLLYGLVCTVARTVFRLRVSGRAHLDGLDGPVLVAANHASDLDPGFVLAGLPLPLAHRMWWGGDVTRLFRSRLARAFSRAAHVLPVDERAPGAAVELGRRVLARGDALGWFPEGWRTPNGALQRFLPGVGAILEDSGATVVPAYIAGSFEVMPRHGRLPRPHPVRVRFGAPATVAELAGEGAGESTAQRIADGLRRRVAALEAESRQGGG